MRLSQYLSKPFLKLHVCYPATCGLECLANSLEFLHAGQLVLLYPYKYM